MAAIEPPMCICAPAFWVAVAEALAELEERETEGDDLDAEVLAEELAEGSDAETEDDDSLAAFEDDEAEDEEDFEAEEAEEESEGLFSFVSIPNFPKICGTYAELVVVVAVVEDWTRLQIDWATVKTAGRFVSDCIIGKKEEKLALGLSRSALAVDTRNGTSSDISTVWTTLASIVGSGTTPSDNGILETLDSTDGELSNLLWDGLAKDSRDEGNEGNEGNEELHDCCCLGWEFRWTKLWLLNWRILKLFASGKVEVEVVNGRIVVTRNEGGRGIYLIRLNVDPNARSCLLGTCLTF